MRFASFVSLPVLVAFQEYTFSLKMIGGNINKRHAPEFSAGQMNPSQKARHSEYRTNKRPADGDGAGTDDRRKRAYQNLHLQWQLRELNSSISNQKKSFENRWRATEDHKLRLTVIIPEFKQYCEEAEKVLEESESCRNSQQWQAPNNV